MQIFRRRRSSDGEVPAIAGAFGGVNAGDEAIAATMISEVRRIYGEGKIQLICMGSESALEMVDYRRKIRNESGLSVISRTQVLTTLLALRNGPLIIGGGQLLNGRRYPAGLLWFLSLAVTAKVLGNPVYIVGVGASGLDASALSEMVCRRLVGLADRVTVRDLHSMEMLVAIGVNPEQLEQTADVVVTQVIKPVPVTATKRDSLFFAVHNSPSSRHYSPSEFARFVDVISSSNPDMGVVLACHDRRPEFDVNFAKEVAGLVHNDCKVEVLESESETLKAYQRARFVLSSRMHPLILGSIAGARVVPIAGSSKVADYAASLGLEPVDLSRADELKGISLESISSEKDLPEALTQRAKRNFDVLSDQIRTPDFLIVGAMKAGTTSLYGDLARVANVWLPSQKEPEVLVKNSSVRSARADYEDLFRRAPADHFLGEASTAYTKRPHADGVAEFASQVCGKELKIIYVTRTPLDRIRSHLRHDWLNGEIRGSYGNNLRADPKYIDISRYDWQLLPWKRAFGSANVLEIRFEEYITNREDVLAEVLEHIGVNHADLPPESPRNSSDSRPTTRSRWVRSLVASDLYKRGVKPYLPKGALRLATSALAPTASAPKVVLSDSDIEYVESELGKLLNG